MRNHNFVYLRKNSKNCCLRVGAIILKTFVSDRPKGMLGCHGKSGTLDDRVENLYWATPKQNMADKYRDGTEQTGEKANGHILNELQVRIIRKSYSFRGKDGLILRELALIFGVSADAIWRIIRGENWKHI